MRGHIVKRGKNSYSIAVSLGKDPATGKYKYQWVSVKGTKKDAEKRLSELLHQLDSGTFMSLPRDEGNSNTFMLLPSLLFYCLRKACQAAKVSINFCLKNVPFPLTTDSNDISSLVFSA